MGQSAQHPEFTPFGTVFQPIGFIGGKPIWPILGGAPDDGEGDGSQSGDGTGTEENDGNENNDGQGNNGDGNGDGTGSESDREDAKTYSSHEYDALHRRMQAADKRAGDAEKRLKAIEDKDKSELDKLREENDELRKREEERAEEFQTLRLRDAFRDASGEKKIVWHNSTLALKELNRDLLTFEDDGTVKGMERAVDKLAKDHPYLVKPEEGSGKKSGGSFNNGSGSGAAIDGKKMAGKYPALRGRGGNG
jgi:hypothetical protein